MSIGFNVSEYTVSESEGSVNVCVTVQQGAMDDNVELNMMVGSESGSAQGE